MRESNDLKDYRHVDLLFPSEYLRGADLMGKEVTVYIEKIEPRHKLRRTDSSTENKPVVYLRGKKKKWVLNKTNAKTIAKLYGKETLEWLGKPITLYSAKVEAFGDVHDAIRVKAQKPRVQSQQQRPEPQPDEGEHDYGPPPMSDEEVAGYSDTRTPAGMET